MTPAQTLYLEVDILGGAAGQIVKGFTDSGAGGGESDVRTCPAAGTCSSGTSLASRLLVAGGGGGTGDFGGAAGNAGTTGAAGDGITANTGRNNAGGGGGATQTAPGAGGAGGGCSNANDDGGSGGGTSHAVASVGSPAFSQAAAGRAPSVTLSYALPALSVTTTSLPGGQVGTAYSQALAATGGVTPYSWSVTGLPPGLSVNPATGVISGTPQTPGTDTFTVTVTDAENPAMTASKQLSIVVKPAPLMITTTSLPAATGGTAYSATLAAIGGITPYTWSVTAGSLPPGLTLNASPG